MSLSSHFVPIENIQNRILRIRNTQVMLDSHLAEMYDVTTGRLNEQVKRNIERFPNDFMFQLTIDEWQNLVSQNAIPNWGGRRTPPFVFTEQGISSLSSVLKSDVAVKVHIMIMRAFVQMRNFLVINSGILERINNLEIKQIENDNKIEKVLKALEPKVNESYQGIFFEGQIFDAYVFVSDLIRKANESIILIDNYIDESVLLLLSKRIENVKVTIYTSILSKEAHLDIKKYCSQYPNISIKQFSQSHDRFIIIDKKTVYHIGASLKDLGKKWFAFSIINFDIEDILNRLKPYK